MGAQPTRQAAHSAADTAKRWLKSGGSSAELLQAGGQAPRALGAGDNLEAIFLEASGATREASPADFFTTLDSAAQALSRRPGLRVLVAVLSSPPLSTEMEKSVNQLVDYCREHRVRVIVLDPMAVVAKGTTPPLEALARRTGGEWLSRAGALDGALVNTSQDSSTPEVAKAPATIAIATTPQEEPEGQFRIPVRTRFVRTANAARGMTGGFQPGSLTGHSGATDPGILVMNEAGLGPNEAGGPLQGLLIVESPLSALKFETDPHTRTYQGHARVTLIVRNSRGEAAWQTQKEINVRGPVGKLEERRSGNLYLMRGVTLPAERYTLEAKVEDLVAGSKGAIVEPLRTPPGARGLFASDVLFVRPFHGSADRFESDQLFNYDGEALSPVLAPEFRAEDSINLNLYLVVYPDLYGAQPDMSMELLRNGQVVGRMALPFRSALRESAREGRSVGILGGKAKEFAYLAAMKGAKLGPGDFEARITVRQGRAILTRSASFHVAGEAVPETTQNGGSIPDEMSSIVMPVLDPVAYTAGASAPPVEVQKRLWEEAAAAAQGYASRLPHFRCNQETHRLRGPASKPDQIKPADTFVDQLTYEDGKESYAPLEANGEKADPNATRGGVASRGEFGSMLGAVFNPETGAKYTWAGRAMAGGVLCHVFEIEVEQKKSNLHFDHRKRYASAGYKGRLYIDEETGLVRRLAIEGSGMPKDYILQSPSLSLDYGMVRIGAQDYLLPLRSVLQVREGKSLVRNETVFRDYRKFEAESAIQYNK